MMLRTSAIAECRTSHAAAIASAVTMTSGTSSPTLQIGLRSSSTATSLSSSAASRAESIELSAPRFVRPVIGYPEKATVAVPARRYAEADRSKFDRQGPIPLVPHTWDFCYVSQPTDAELIASPN